jgi:pSer/pThr/pTyr-binding forkhead associated (FHA) protein
MKRNGTVKKSSNRKNLPTDASYLTSFSSSSSSFASSGELILGHLRQLSPFLPPSSVSSQNSQCLTFKSTKLVYSIGDSSSCDYIISDPHISSQHCNISITIAAATAGTCPSFLYSLTDTSTNGTYVNNKLIHQTSCPLKSGDHIDFFISGSDDRLSFLFQLTYDDSDEQEQQQQGQRAAKEIEEKEENEEPVTKKRKTLRKTKSLPANAPSTSPSPATVGAAGAAEGPHGGALPSASVTPVAAGSPGEASDPTAGTAAAIATASAKMSMASLLEDKLQCSICCEVIYEASTTVPCMHSYCGGCISSWLVTSGSGKQAKCPLCNHRIEQINRNHVLNEMISELIQLKPELERSEQEKIEMKKRNTIVYGKALGGTRGAGGGEDDEDDEDEDDYDEDEDEEEDEEEEDDPPIAPYRIGFMAAAPVAPAPAPAPVVMTAAMRSDVESFQRITGASQSEATRYITGAAQRGLVPHLDNALSYFFEQQN